MPEQGDVRLRGGFGTPCDPLHTGFVEVFNAGEWGAICSALDLPSILVADVVCRQLGFPHGTVVDPINPRPRFTDDYVIVEEADEPQDRFWLGNVVCSGPEARLLDCGLGSGFLTEDACSSSPVRLTVACRKFAVPEALEAVTTPGAGADLTAVHAQLLLRSEYCSGLRFCQAMEPVYVLSQPMRHESTHHWHRHRLPRVRRDEVGATAFNNAARRLMTRVITRIQNLLQRHTCRNQFQ